MIFADGGEENENEDDIMDEVIELLEGDEWK